MIFAVILFKQQEEQLLKTTIRELNVQEIDAVAGGNTLPPAPSPRPNRPIPELPDLEIPEPDRGIEPPDIPRLPVPPIPPLPTPG